MLNGFTTICVKKITKRRLSQLGTLSDNYDSVVNKLITCYAYVNHIKITDNKVEKERPNPNTPAVSSTNKD